MSLSNVNSDPKSLGYNKIENEVVANDVIVDEDSELFLFQLPTAAELDLNKINSMQCLNEKYGDGYVLFGANLLNATPEKKYAVLSEKSCGDSLFVVLPQTSEDSDTHIREISKIAICSVEIKSVQVDEEPEARSPEQRQGKEEEASKTVKSSSKKKKRKASSVGIKEEISTDVKSLKTEKSKKKR